ncbi:hypothetical protein HYH03_017591 [Edaphochlamys debaryana]|uniref:Protein kinase domain-containing protein n=1 Tax=Edaphochlamys debaryana TaxID=47281 RepID=A0A836BP50_9CHLO|nr:hypothetical protein HYH03_017591 [Edaphochlamys debaryana]|eukprot:KAG2483537.1 hypothetical protein HYH03_017591 [Edaphochlamys debaryana]
MEQAVMQRKPLLLELPAPAQQAEPQSPAASASRSTGGLPRDCRADLYGMATLSSTAHSPPAAAFAALPLTYGRRVVGVLWVAMAAGPTAEGAAADRRKSVEAAGLELLRCPAALGQIASMVSMALSAAAPDPAYVAWAASAARRLAAAPTLSALVYETCTAVEEHVRQAFHLTDVVVQSALLPEAAAAQALMLRVELGVARGAAGAAGSGAPLGSPRTPTPSGVQPPRDGASGLAGNADAGMTGALAPAATPSPRPPRRPQSLASPLPLRPDSPLGAAPGGTRTAARRAASSRMGREALEAAGEGAPPLLALSARAFRTSHTLLSRLALDPAVCPATLAERALLRSATVAPGPSSPGRPSGGGGSDSDREGDEEGQLEGVPHGIVVPNTAQHIADVLQPNRDVILLFECKRAASCQQRMQPTPSLASEAAPSEALRAHSTATAPLSFASPGVNASMPYSAVQRGNGGGPGCGSLVLLGLGLDPGPGGPDGAPTGCLLGLYAAFSVPLPEALLRAVRDSCRQLLGRMILGIVRHKLLVPEIAHDLGVLRAGVPGSYVSVARVRAIVDSLGVPPARSPLAASPIPLDLASSPAHTAELGGPLVDDVLAGDSPRLRPRPRPRQGLPALPSGLGGTTHTPFPDDSAAEFTHLRAGAGATRREPPGPVDGGGRGVQASTDSFGLHWGTGGRLWGRDTERSSSGPQQQGPVTAALALRTRSNLHASTLASAPRDPRTASLPASAAAAHSLSPLLLGTAPTCPTDEASSLTPPPSHATARRRSIATLDSATHALLPTADAWALSRAAARAAAGVSATAGVSEMAGSVPVEVAESMPVPVITLLQEPASVLPSADARGGGAKANGGMEAADSDAVIVTCTPACDTTGTGTAEGRTSFLNADADDGNEDDDEAAPHEDVDRFSIMYGNGCHVDARVDGCAYGNLGIADANISTAPATTASAAAVMTVQDLAWNWGLRGLMGGLVESLMSTLRHSASELGETMLGSAGAGRAAEALEDLYLRDVLGHGAMGVVMSGLLGTTPVAVKLVEMEEEERAASAPLSETASSSRCSHSLGLSALAALPKAAGEPPCAGPGGPQQAPPRPQQQQPRRTSEGAQVMARRLMYRSAMELAVMKTITHVNIVQAYAVFDNVIMEPAGAEGAPGAIRLRKLDPDCRGPCASPICTAIVQELCDRGSLGDELAHGTFPGLLQPPPERPPQERPKGARVPPSLRGGREEAAPSAPPAAIDMRGVYLTLLEVALALRHLHSKRLVHRDVKPANILLRSNPLDPRGWTCKLADFGLARILDKQDVAPQPLLSNAEDVVCRSSGSQQALHDSTAGGGSAYDRSSRFASPGASLPRTFSAGALAAAHASSASHSRGSPASAHGSGVRQWYTLQTQASGTVTHMAPEAMKRGARVDASVDVYSFGILMWELTCGGGDRPYSALEPDDIPKAVRGGLRPAFGSHVPRAYRDLALSCWSGEPHRRPCAAELVVAVKAQLSGWMLRAQQA